MTIHDTFPFAEPADVVRRFRGRLGGAVSLWTAGAEGSRAGLTVSSLVVANGDPAHLLGLLDPDADLTEALRSTGVAVVQLLGAHDRGVAEAFGGSEPSPGGPFRSAVDWVQGDHGPVLGGRTHALVRLESLREVGWSVLADVVVEGVHVAEDDAGLEHRRGRYRSVGGLGKDRS
ncbi:flavin reductase (DIM6/NTAB) family NADH-FMN oxidoreductase RutF [Marmoricola sp. OAE513]|uniref:flavin reductase family protein n=1 Tax=Marmoricola sp. OAE513 TaxID=2817894 RepID=UPI001AE70383